jgi:hypothetical protein
LLAQNPKTGVKLEDETLVEELRKVDEDLAHRYLEHVVVIKRSPNRALHQQLLDRLLDAAAAEVQDEGVKYHLEELGEFQPAAHLCIRLTVQMQNIVSRPTRSHSSFSWRMLPLPRQSKCYA